MPLRLRSSTSRGVTAFVYLLLAWTFANVYDYVLPRNMDVTIEQLANFTARKPMQLRVLVPAMMHAAQSVLPLGLTRWNKLATIAATLAVLLLFERWLRSFLSERLASLTAPLILIPLFWNYCLLTFVHYPSDIPGIALFLACLLLWRGRRLLFFFLVFTVACFNRETILFLIPCLIVLHWGERSTRKALLLSCAAMLTIYAAIRLYLEFVFLDNTGGGLENHLSYNLQVITHLPTIGQGVGRYFVFLFGGMHLLSLAMLRRTASALRRLVIVTPLYWLVMLVAGVLLEGRIYGELIPIYAAASLVPLMQRAFPEFKEERPAGPEQPSAALVQRADTTVPALFE